MVLPPLDLERITKLKRLYIATHPRNPTVLWQVEGRAKPSPFSMAEGPTPPYSQWPTLNSNPNTLHQQQPNRGKGIKQRPPTFLPDQRANPIIANLE